MTAYQPKTGEPCGCKRGVQRDNCPACEGTGWRIDFAAIRARHTTRYGVEVLVEEQTPQGRVKTWKRMHPTGGPPYVWDTKQEAQSNIFCEPWHRDLYRIVEVKQ
jgi:hypothetical protein